MDDSVPLRVAAHEYGIKLDRLRRAAWQGRLQARQLGNQWLVTRPEVERFLRDGGREPDSASGSIQPERTTRARVIAVAVPKGGTGKTTTTLNLGAAMAEQGRRVLLVDLDPQGSLSLALGIRPQEVEHTIYSALKYFLSTYESQIETAIQPTGAGVDLIPSNIRLNVANAELTIAPQGELILQKLLAPVLSHYDTILIDTLPYLGILVLNALVAAQSVLIPLETEYLATESVTLMLEQIQFMRRSGLNPDLSIAGILLTQTDNRTVMGRQVAEYARREFGTRVPVFETSIKRSVRFPESQAVGKSILQYEPAGEGARAYRALAKEVWNAPR